LCLSKIIEALSGSSFECQTPLKNNTVLGWNVHSLSIKQSEKLFSRQYVHHEPELLRDNVSAWMVWPGISIDGKTDLHVIAGNLSGVRYRDEILHPIVRPYAGAVGDGFILMDDNARPHTCVHHESLQRNVTRL
jgi:hypothetical protein